MPAQNIHITDEQQAHAKQLVKEGEYATVSAYMSDLIRRDQERRAYGAKLLALIEEGLNSGEGIEMTPEQAGEYIRQGAERARAEADRKAG